MSTQAHILIVDDDPQVLKLFKQILMREGYSVMAVASGAAAIRILAEQAIDLLVLDLSMPDQDGFELLKILRQKDPELRILMVSGFLQGALLRTSEFLGATASMNKTDAPKLLVETVARLLSN